MSPTAETRLWDAANPIHIQSALDDFTTHVKEGSEPTERYHESGLAMEDCAAYWYLRGARHREGRGDLALRARLWIRCSDGSWPALIQLDGY
jgi:hypothetical protein